MTAPSPYAQQQPLIQPIKDMMDTVMPDPKRAPIKLQSVAETLKGFGYGDLLPNDQYMYPTGEAGWQMEKPLVRYRAGLLPYVDQIFIFKWDRTASGGLELSTDAVKDIQLFQQGVGDPGQGTGAVGSSMGAWWNLTSADSTFETQGAPVYDGNSFWAFGHTIAYEGIYYRGGNGTDTDNPKVGAEFLDDGAGSYSELMLQRAAFDIALLIQNQGSGCPNFLDVLGANGDRSQLIGGGRHSISLPVFPYARWMRPNFFGAQNQYAKMGGTFTSSTGIEIAAIAGNEIPEDIDSVYMQFRIRIYGLRVCGNPDDGC